MRKTEKTEQFANALRSCMADSATVKTAAALTVELERFSYPVNGSTARRYVSGDIFPPEEAFSAIYSVLKKDLVSEKKLDVLQHGYEAVREERYQSLATAKTVNDDKKESQHTDTSHVENINLAPYSVSGLYNTIVLGANPKKNDVSIYVSKILQRNGSYIVLDRCGLIKSEVCDTLEENGYQIIELDHKDIACTVGDDLILPISKNDDHQLSERISYLVDLLMDEILDRNQEFDLFYQRAARNLFNFLLQYTILINPSGNCSISSLRVVAMDIYSNQDKFRSDLRNYINSHTSSDISYLGRLYDTYLLLPERTRLFFILEIISTLARMEYSVRANSNIENSNIETAISLDDLVKKPFAVFLNVSDLESENRFFMTVLLNNLLYYLRHECSSFLNQPIHFILPDFHKLGAIDQNLFRDCLFVAHKLKADFTLSISSKKSWAYQLKKERSYSSETMSIILSLMDQTISS